MHIYEYLSIEKEDFVNISLDKGKDVRYFVDPYRINENSDSFSILLQSKLYQYFNNIAKALFNNTISEKTLGNLSEVEYAKLGYGEKFGSGSESVLKERILKALLTSDVKNTGLIKDIFDIHLFVRDIGRDRMSDWILNICFQEFSSYTDLSVSKYPKITEKSTINHDYYDSNETWKSTVFYLPKVDEVTFLLLPLNVCSHEKTVIQGYGDFFRNAVLDVIIKRANECDEFNQLITEYKSKANHGKLKPPTKKKIEEYLVTIGKNKSQITTLLWLNDLLPNLIDEAKKIYFAKRKTPAK